MLSLIAITYFTRPQVFKEHKTLQQVSCDIHCFLNEKFDFLGDSNRSSIAVTEDWRNPEGYLYVYIRCPEKHRKMLGAYFDERFDLVIGCPHGHIRKFIGPDVFVRNPNFKTTPKLPLKNY